MKLFPEIVKNEIWEKHLEVAKRELKNKTCQTLDFSPDVTTYPLSPVPPVWGFSDSFALFSRSKAAEQFICSFFVHSFIIMSWIVSSQLLCWSPNLQCLRLWLYLETESLRRNDCETKCDWCPQKNRQGHGWLCEGRGRTQLASPGDAQEKSLLIMNFQPREPWEIDFCWWSHPGSASLHWAHICTYLASCRPWLHCCPGKLPESPSWIQQPCASCPIASSFLLCVFFLCSASQYTSKSIYLLISVFF